MATGLMFAKFARPAARVGFADHAVVRQRNGRPVLMLRMSNHSRNQVVDAKVQVVALDDTTTTEGEHMRSVIDLPLVRASTPAFMMTWTIMHIIDENSPLHGLTADNKHEVARGLIVNFMGLDVMFSQTVHAQRLYYMDALKVGYRYRDMIDTDNPRLLTVHHDRLHDIELIPE